MQSGGYKVCPRCAKKMVLSVPNCLCGHVFRTPGAGPRTNSKFLAAGSHTCRHTPSGLPTTCRNCGIPSGQKVSAIYREGSWDSQSVAASVGVGYASTGQSILTVAESVGQGRGQTRLAQVLSPPNSPGVTNVSWGSVYLCSAATMGCLVFAVGNWVAGQLVPGLGALLLAVGAGMGIWANRRQLAREQQQSLREYDAEFRRYQLALQRWGELYYCGRCDMTYNPQTGQAVPVTAVHSLL